MKREPHLWPGPCRRARSYPRLMNARSFVAGLVVAALVAVSPTAARPVAARGPYLLVSLASLGTVTWRCNPARKPSLALGFRAFKSSADSYVRLHAGRHTYTNRQVIPGQAVSFPFIRPQRQQLDISQGTEAGETTRLHHCRPCSAELRVALLAICAAPGRGANAASQVTDQLLVGRQYRSASLSSWMVSRRRSVVAETPHSFHE